ncbi:MAG: haloacid dehalogenase-like hydrolase [Bacteroidales bacterium]|nr:haloacid dehalogenase-like hydrolase [Bacteroidales bacterium]
MKYIAFFDLDHTILSVNSGEALLKRGYEKGLVSVWKLITALLLTLIYKLHLVDPLKLIGISGKWLANASVAEIEALCNEIVENDLIPKIRPEMIREIQQHRENGAELVMLSSALSTICNPLAKHLQLDAVLCSELEVENQYYTGLPKGDSASGKRSLFA